MDRRQFKAAGTELFTSDGALRVLYENDPLLLITLDEKGIILTANSSSLAVLGCSPQDLIGKPFTGFIHPSDHDAMIEHLRELSSHPGVVQCSEFRMTHGTGKTIWLRDSARAFTDNRGQLCFLLVCDDITEKKLEQLTLSQAEAARLQSEERFSKVFQSSPVPTCITSWEDGRLIDANPAFWSLSGFGPEEMLNRSVLEASANNPEKHRAFLERLDRQKSIRDLQDVFHTRSGEVLNVSIYYEIIHLNDRKCILSMFHDITEQKKTHDDVKRKEAILSSITFAADQFLRSPGWTTNMDAILERFGQAAEVSRVYIFKVLSKQDSGMVVSNIFEWCAPGITPMLDDPILQSFDMTASGLQRWADMFEKGEPVFGVTRELPPQEQTEFLRENILSIACVPILVERNLWGFIGLDDCLQERRWSHNEIDSLRTAANILSSAIQREFATQAANRQLRELMMLHTAAVAYSSAVDMDTLISGLTEIIHTALRPDNCGVLLVDETGNYLIPHPSYCGGVSEELLRHHDIHAGVAGMVVAGGQAIRLGDVRSAARYLEVQSGIRSELCVPLVSNGKIIGVINIESALPDAFDEADERLIKTIAGGLATSLEKIQLFQAEGRRAREAERLREATTTLTSSLDLNTLLNTVLDLLTGFAPYDSASIGMLEGDEFRTVAGRNIPSAVIGKTYSLDRENLQPGDLREPILRAAAPGEPDLSTLEAIQGIRSWMGIPLYAQNALIGFINLNSRQEFAYRPAMVSLVQTFANQAASAVQNANLFVAEQQRRKESETLREVPRSGGLGPRSGTGHPAHPGPIGEGRSLRLRLRAAVDRWLPRDRGGHRLAGA